MPRCLFRVNVRQALKLSLCVGDNIFIAVGPLKTRRGAHCGIVWEECNYSVLIGNPPCMRDDFSQLQVTCIEVIKASVTLIKWIECFRSGPWGFRTGQGKGHRSCLASWKRSMCKLGKHNTFVV